MNTRDLDYVEIRLYASTSAMAEAYSKIKPEHPDLAARLMEIMQRCNDECIAICRELMREEE